MFCLCVVGWLYLVSCLCLCVVLGCFVYYLLDVYVVVICGLLLFCLIQLWFVWWWVDCCALLVWVEFAMDVLVRVWCF